MNHMRSISVERPAKADIFGHPDIGPSLGGILKDPLGTVWEHVTWLFKWI